MDPEGGRHSERESGDERDSGLPGQREVLPGSGQVGRPAARANSGLTPGYRTNVGAVIKMVWCNS